MPVSHSNTFGGDWKLIYHSSNPTPNIRIICIMQFWQMQVWSRIPTYCSNAVKFLNSKVPTELPLHKQTWQHYTLNLAWLFLLCFENAESLGKVENLLLYSRLYLTPYSTSLQFSTTSSNKHYYEELDHIPNSCSWLIVLHMLACVHQPVKGCFVCLRTRGSTHHSAHAACNSTDRKVWVPSLFNR